ncbi:hypothetical protein, conserved [Leishmania tarentolae]|uniref:Uncharacterized protein n=1 Tax=Leishmania tarentolae TaxID=5689 RepID=A0A640KFL5_LEITA|nr:hypothetical protein, conserved [Leishmania tarentolae]
MDVFLNVVQTASASPVSASSICSDHTQRTGINSPAVPSENNSTTSFTVGSLSLSHRETQLGSNVAAKWSVSLCSPAEDESADGFDGGSQAVPSASSPGRPTASPPSPTPSSFVHIAANSVDITDLRGRWPPDGHATASTVDLLCEKLRRLKAAIVNAGNADAPLVERAETVFFCGSRLDTRKDVLYLVALHRLLVESLLIVKGRSLSSPSPPPLDVDVSLVDYDEGWGAGDVLATEMIRTSAHGTPGQRNPITWMPLGKVLEYAPRPRSAMAADSATALEGSTSPMESSTNNDLSTVQLAQLVRQRLQVWFDRIDSATSEFPSAPVSPCPPNAADRLRHLERNVVFFTFRLRSCKSTWTPSLDARLSSAYFTLVLLPECGATPPNSKTSTSLAADGVSSCLASAARWREFEALSAFMRSLSQIRHRHHGEEQKGSGFKENGRATAATVQAKMRAAALRRSRWLTTIAHIHNSPAPLTRARATGTGEHSTDNVIDCFLRSSTVRSFSWIGCIAAAASHQRATRTTLVFLSRLQPLQMAPRRLMKAGKMPSPQNAVDAPLGGIPCTRKNVADSTDEGTPPKAEESSSSPATFTPLLPSPRPSVSVPQPYSSPCFHGGSATNMKRAAKVGTAVASHLPLVGELSTDLAPAAPPSQVGSGRLGAENKNGTSSLGAGHKPASSSQADALDASTRVYESVLEEEVRRLRHRLQRYEAEPCHGGGNTGDVPAHTPHQEVQEFKPAQASSIGLPTSHTTSQDICGSLPLLVQAAIDDLCKDTRFPQALHAKLDSLTHRLEHWCTAAVQAGRNCLADSPAAQQQWNEKNDGRDAYVAQLEAKVALYEQKLALMDYYVVPTLVQCVDDLEQWQVHQKQRERTPAAGIDNRCKIPSPPHPALLPKRY